MNNVIHKIFLNILLVMLGLSTLITPQQSYAQELEQYTHVTITPEKTHVSAGETITIATEITLAPNWHVYWRNPGDSGLPVVINWDTPDGLKLSDIQWPTPHKISYDILANYGYYKKVTLLQTLDIPKDNGQKPITLNASIEMLVCDEICIPENAEITLTLNGPNTPPLNNSAIIQSAQSKMPKPLSGTFLYEEQTTDNGKTLNLTLTPNGFTKNLDAEKLDYYPHELGIINHNTAPTVTIKQNTIHLTHERGDQPLNKNLRGLLIVKEQNGHNQGYSITIPAKHQEKETAPQTRTAEFSANAQTNTGAPIGQQDLTWFSALYLALFGGLVLNLMPCVFPILSMKALSLVKMKGSENKAARTQGLAYTLGVILSFLAIGAILLILKQAGNAIGWGFQLQNPVVVALLAYLLFVIGLNLIGLFEFNTRFTNVGSTLANKKSTSGSFFTGVLATLVATPCTAPFMGAAMGYAITQPAIVSMSVFAALGFGLALPYLLLSCIPALRHILPKPGAWMDTFKQFLAFPMFASSIWLVWVLNNQAGAYSILLVLFGMLAIAFALWLTRLNSAKKKDSLLNICALVFLTVPLITLTYLKTTAHKPNDQTTQEARLYEPFSNERLHALLKTDKPIFVEMTADWCITCKFNHAIAINIDSTKALLKRNGIQYLVGDWTNRDKEISDYLATFKRNGVPLYVYYGPPDDMQMRPPPVILPQILTAKILHNVLDKVNPF